MSQAPRDCVRRWVTCFIFLFSESGSRAAQPGTRATAWPKLNPLVWRAAGAAPVVLVGDPAGVRFLQLQLADKVGEKMQISVDIYLREEAKVPGQRWTYTKSLLVLLFHAGDVERGRVCVCVCVCVHVSGSSFPLPHRRWCDAYVACEDGKASRRSFVSFFFVNVIRNTPS